MQTDSQLVQATLEGKLDAFDGLVRRYQSAVYGLALARTRDFHQAQDVAQEAFLQAYLCLATLRYPDRFGAWLLGICRNVASKWRRRNRALTRWEPLMSESSAEKPSMLWGESPETPAEAMERQEQQREFQEALERLPNKSREVLVLFYLVDFSYREIAGLLGIPPTAVQSRLQVARQRLNKEMRIMVAETLRDHPLPEEFNEKVMGQVYQQLSRSFGLRWEVADGHTRALEVCDKLHYILDELHHQDKDQPAKRSEVRLAKGEILLYPLGKIQEARTCFEEALSIASQHEVTFHEINAYLGLAEADAVEGKPDSALTHLLQARERILQQTQSVLEAHGQGPGMFKNHTICRLTEVLDVSKLTREDIRWLLRDEMQRLSFLVRATLEAGGYDRKTPVDVVSLLQDSLGLVGKWCEAQHIQVTQELAPLLPFRGSPVLLKQAFLNLLMNAVEAMPEGSKLTVRSWVTTFHQSRIEFEDTGCGIDKEAFSRIFHPGYTTKREGAAGLGLTIVKENIEKLGGDLRVESVLGEGSTFIIELPGREDYH